jgi:hypothetical protein
VEFKWNIIDLRKNIGFNFPFGSHYFYFITFIVFSSIRNFAWISFENSSRERWIKFSALKYVVKSLEFVKLVLFWFHLEWFSFSFSNSITGFAKGTSRIKRLWHSWIISVNFSEIFVFFIWCAFSMAFLPWSRGKCSENQIWM